MFPLRILGGPIAKSDRIVVDVAPSTTFGEVFALIRGVLQPAPSPPISSEFYDLMELQVVEGQKAKPISVYQLSATPASVNMTTPVVFLKRNDRPFTMQVAPGGGLGSPLAGGSAGNLLRLGRSQSVSFAQGLEEGSGSSDQQGIDSSPLQRNKFQSFAFTEPIARNALLLSQAMQQQQQPPPGSKDGSQPSTSSPLLKSSSSSSSFYLGSSAEKYMMPPAHRSNSVVGDMSSGQNERAVAAAPTNEGKSAGVDLNNPFFGPLVASSDGAAVVGSPTPLQRRTSRSRFSVDQSSSSFVAAIGPASTAREQLHALFNVKPTEQPARVVLLNQLLRKAARLERVEDFVHSAEVAAANSANTGAMILASESILSIESQVASSSPSPSSSATVAAAGSPLNILRRAKSIAAMEGGGTGLTKQQVRHIQFRGLCNSVIWKVLDAFLPAERIAQPDVVASFLDEVREMPKAHIAALMFRFQVQKSERMDFERDVQFERFDIELIEFVKREQLRRLLIIRTFFVGWCTWQRFFLINYEQMDRFRIWDDEEAEALGSEQTGFLLLEMSRRWSLAGMELRHRFLIKLFNVQVLEQHARDAVTREYFRVLGLIDFEREICQADRVRDRIARSCWQGFLHIHLAKTTEQQQLHRAVLVKKEYRTRLLLLELYEQLHRKFMEEKILEWVTPIMKKIASKAVEDGKILLAVEMKERQYANARFEARQRSMSKDRRASGGL